MGGHIEGEKASAIVARVLATHVAKHIYLPLFAPDNEGYRVPFTELLSEAIQKANGEVIKHVPKGGTTATAVVIIGDLIHIAHVGDSRVELVAGFQRRGEQGAEGEDGDAFALAAYFTSP